jgi:hypothetical protein
MKITWFSLTLLLAWPLVCAAEPAQISRNDNLRLKPFADAKVVAPLKSGQSVDIQKREGAWYLLKVGKVTGWAPMLSVRRTATAASASAGSLTQTASGRAATGKVVATTGVRGLGEENLKEAAFSEAAIAVAEQYRVTAQEAVQFAQAGGLKPRNVPTLKAEGGTP